jgi:glyoxylase-like metal-dependent hydrolase (beta-lactamase superfamily II)
METVTIIPVRLGIVTTYIVKQEGAILIDTGTPGSEDAILSALEKAGINPGDLRLIVLTHGHGDHAGSAARMKELTGAKLAIHEKDAGMLRTGIQGPLVPTGFVGRIAKIVIGPVNCEGYPAADPDIVIDGIFDLGPFGVSGKIVPTPGHTPGSVSVVLENGDVFCGDLIFPQIPTGKPGLPFWATSPADICGSVRALLLENPRTFYPGHGGPFLEDRVRVMVDNRI